MFLICFILIFMVIMRLYVYKYDIDYVYVCMNDVYILIDIL
jgi:hypothetical protein